jgi:hypothetical protein
MTTEKHLKRAARRLAETEGITYTAALRLLTVDAGESYTLGPVYDVLERHSIYCVGDALQEAIDLGIDTDSGIRQVAAQRLEDRDTPCRCLTKPGQPSPWATFHVVVKFQVPPVDTGRFIDLADFAWQLFDLLGIYSAVDIRWNARQIDGTGVVQVDAHTFIVAVTLPEEVPATATAEEIALGAAQAGGAVARALLGLGYDQESAVIDHAGISLSLGERAGAQR